MTFAASTKGLPDNSFIMLVLMNYGDEHVTPEKQLLDSGAYCCACPRTTPQTARQSHYAQNKCHD